MKEDEIMQIAIQAGNTVDREWLKRFATLVAFAEREACAKVCEERGMVKGGEVFAARIRARGNT